MATGLENLKIYILARDLEIEVFNLTKTFPKDEQYRSVDQLRRSSSSVSNNIAESYHKRSLKERTRILNDIVKGEAEETKRNLDVCQRKGLHNNSNLSEQYTELLKMVSGYIRFLRTREEELLNVPTSKLKN
ncbi:MAG: four helix bundle protein [bacterium]|nr:four helix bundle protein [bacterium]